MKKSIENTSCTTLRLSIAMLSMVLCQPHIHSMERPEPAVLFKEIERRLNRTEEDKHWIYTHSPVPEELWQLDNIENFLMSSRMPQESSAALKLVLDILPLEYRSRIEALDHDTQFRMLAKLMHPDMTARYRNRRLRTLLLEVFIRIPRTP